MGKDIGIRGALYLNGVDVTYQLGLRTSNVTETQDAVETTCYDPAGLNARTKTYAAGLNGAVVSFDSYPDLDYDAMVTKARALFDRTVAAYILNPITPDIGALTIFGKVLQTKWSPGLVHDQITKLGLDFLFTAGSPGFQCGFQLFTPTGSSALDVDEEQTLTFTNAPASQTFRLKATGGSDTAEFTPADSNATIKAAIEGLDEYDGFTATVAGSLSSSTVDGITVYNGTKTVTFDPADNVPQLVVIDSESQKLTVTSGDSGNYTLGGSANFALGDSIASIQTKVRAVGGNYTSVVLAGVSVAPSGGTTEVTVSGAGNGLYNGTFVQDADFDGKHTFLSGTHAIWWHSASTTWRLTTGVNNNNGNAYYYTNDDGTLDPPETGWAAQAMTAPAPTVEVDVTGATGGTAAIYLFFPPSVGNIANAGTTGTGAVVSNVTQGPGNTSTLIAVTTSTPGVGSEAIYNVVNSVTNGTTHNDIDVAETSNNGLIAQLNCLYLEEGEEAQWILQHAPNNAGVAGTWATLGSFANITEVGAQQLEIAAGTTINPFLRARRTDSGGDCVVGIAATRL